MSIPKIIHQTAPNNKLKWHPIWEVCQQTWKDNFPDFEYVLWNDDDIRKLVYNDYPQYVQEYDSWPYHIMRVDFARFCILHKYGGIYADMDIFCYKNFYEFLNKNDIYILESWPEWGESVQNSLMASVPNHTFWLDCCQKSIKMLHNMADKNIITNKNTFILNAFGPRLLTKLIPEGMGILSKEVFNPKIYPQFNHFPDCKSPEYQELLKYFNETNKNNEFVFTRHYLTGMW